MFWGAGYPGLRLRLHPGLLSGARSAGLWIGENEQGVNRENNSQGGVGATALQDKRARIFVWRIGASVGFVIFVATLRCSFAPVGGA